jgi:quinol monooxygenase YgiN
MICHLVFYRLKAGTSEKDERALIDQAQRRLAKVPGVKNLKAGKGIAGSHQSYAVVLTMDFEDEAALDAYRVNPDHQAFVKEVAEPMVSGIWRFDFLWSETQEVVAH